MTVSLLTLLQGVGVVALATVAFAVALTWFSLVPSILRMGPERSRIVGFGALAVALLVTAVPLYLAPGVLLRDALDAPSAGLLTVTWMIAVVALVVRGLLTTGVTRAISFAFAVVASSGLIAGFISAACAQHRIVDSITPTGAFLLVIGGIAGVIFWSRTDSESRVVRQGA